jgi:Na+-driven multidrug efflux pump
MVPATGMQMTIANFFSAIGKPTRGVILSLTRQVLLIVPLLLIIPLFLGLDGVLYAAPITDFLAFLLATVFAIFEFKRPEYKTK